MLHLGLSLYLIGQTNYYHFKMFDGHGNNNNSQSTDSKCDGKAIEINEIKVH